MVHYSITCWVVWVRFDGLVRSLYCDVSDLARKLYPIAMIPYRKLWLFLSQCWHLFFCNPNYLLLGGYLGFAMVVVCLVVVVRCFLSSFYVESWRRVHIIFKVNHTHHNEYGLTWICNFGPCFYYFRLDFLKLQDYVLRTLAYILNKNLQELSST